MSLRDRSCSLSFAGLVSGFLALCVVGCGSEGGRARLLAGDSGCAGADCPCHSDLDCGAGRHCALDTGRCEECVADAHCRLGERCVAGHCAAGCGPARGCGDAGTCEVDAGACVACTSDRDCAAPTPRCEPGRYQCVECLTSPDDCPDGSFCSRQGKDGVPACVPGCKKDAECMAPGGTAACVDGVCTLRGCHAGFADCDRESKSGCEVNTGEDPKHCGGCAMACSENHVPMVTCSNGSCGGACAANWADCNRDPRRDGCEVDTATDLRHCGACDAACSAAGGTPSCAGGRCQIACNAGFADCDNLAGNGCEVRLSDDAANCGACGRACPGRNGTPSCANSTCRIACHAGFGDCNNDVLDGCEIDVRGDVKSCGACGKSCPAVANATPACAMGACAFACLFGFGDCDGNPMNGCEAALAVDLSNCGSCGARCAAPANAQATCGAGRCGFACNQAFGDCDGNAGNGCERSLIADAANCGACNRVCAAAPNSSPTCAMGLCGLSCNGGFGNCDGNAGNGCEAAFAVDASHCGGCGVACKGAANAIPTCAMSQCGIQCNPNFGDCDGMNGNGCEVPLAADVKNCGGCGVVCAGGANASAACAAGKCGLSCSNGYGNCDGNNGNGCEALLASDSKNCGACGVACLNSQCINGACGDGSCNAPLVFAPEGGLLTGKMNGNSTTAGSCGYGGVDRYLVWTAPRTGTATINYTTDYWPASIYVRRNNCNGPEVICRSSVGPWPNLNFSFAATAGSVYFIIVDANYIGPILLTFNVTVTPPP